MQGVETSSGREPSGGADTPWENLLGSLRFEPLLVGNGTVVVVPLRDLDSEDRIVLRVTLVDGTEVLFTLRARPPWNSNRESAVASPW
jgi:hypothetical protein